MRFPNIHEQEVHVIAVTAVLVKIVKSSNSRSSEGTCRRAEPQDDVLFPVEVTEANFASINTAQGEIRCLVAGFRTAAKTRTGRMLQEFTIFEGLIVIFF